MGARTLSARTPSVAGSSGSHRPPPTASRSNEMPSLRSTARSASWPVQTSTNPT